MPDHKATDLAWPGIHPDGLRYGDVDGEGPETGIQDGSRPRATAMAIFAREMGVEWRAVSCFRRYVRFFTRQESWESGALDNFLDDAASEWLDARGLKWKDDAWRDADGTAYELPPEPSHDVPPDWEADEDDPVWSFCARSHPESVPVWVLEC